MLSVRKKGIISFLSFQILKKFLKIKRKFFKLSKIKILIWRLPEFFINRYIPKASGSCLVCHELGGNSRTVSTSSWLCTLDISSSLCASASSWRNCASEREHKFLINLTVNYEWEIKWTKNQLGPEVALWQGILSEGPCTLLRMRREIPCPPCHVYFLTGTHMLCLPLVPVRILKFIAKAGFHTSAWSLFPSAYSGHCSSQPFLLHIIFSFLLLDCSLEQTNMFLFCLS